MNRRQFLATSALALNPTLANAKESIAQALKKAKFHIYAKAKGYCEGPTWVEGEVFFCCDGLLRVDTARRVSRHLDLQPAGTVLGGKRTLLICDNKHKSILRFDLDGKLEVLADRFDGMPLRSLNDLTLDIHGNIYWTDPVGSSVNKPIGHVFRLRPNGRVDRVATGLAFPNGLDVDPASKNLFVIESVSKKILRYSLRDNGNLGKPKLFYNLGGNGGDGCAFDGRGNLWVADTHRPETKRGRITVLNPEGKLVATLDSPTRSLSNITFGGPNHNEIFCTTDTPNGVIHAKVGVRGFLGHPARPIKALRELKD